MVDGGSTADAHVAGGGDAAVFSGGMTWKYDGTMHTANIVLGSRRKDTIIDFLEVVGAEGTTGDGVAIAISDVTPNNPNTIGGTYTCPGTTNQILIFTYNLTGSASPMSCTIVLTQAGVAGSQNAVGTFEAVLSNGHNITEGMFDTPVMAQ